jgi:hypothetical protein
VRGVSLSQPVPLGSEPGGAALPVVRGQLPEPMILQPLPKIEIYDKDLKPLPRAEAEGKKGTVGREQKPFPKVDPKEQPKEQLPPPPPMPSPIFDSLGLGCDDGCMDDLCSPGRGRRRLCGCDPCCPDRGRAWISAEYLMFFQKGQATPPLVTSSPAGTPFNSIGVLPGATVLYDRVPDHMISGARFSGGIWSNHFQNLGIDGSFFFLGQVNNSTTFTSDGSQFLARPFTNLNPTLPASEPFSTSTRNGFARIDTYSQLWSMDVNLRYKLWCRSNCWVDFLAGYRTVTLREGIDIIEDFTFLANDPSGAAPGTRSVERDSFGTHNIFNGGQIGLQSEWRFANRWSLGMTSKVAFGVMTEIIDINGSTTTSLNGASVTQSGALLALAGTNIGHYSQTRYAVVPEFGLTLNYNITDNLSVFLGYNFLYLSNVVRPNDQIDPFVNQGFRANGNGVGPQRPAVLFATTDYWAMGMNIGMRYRW